jgi:hypothetical protein
MQQVLEGLVFFLSGMFTHTRAARVVIAGVKQGAVIV